MITLSLGYLLSISTNANVRSEASVSDRAHRVLVESIRKRGLLTPIQLRRIGGHDTYEIVQGFRRILALKETHKVEDMIPCDIIENIDSLAANISTQLEVDKTLVKLTSYDKAIACDNLETSEEYSRKDIIENIGCTDGHYKNLKAIARMHPTVHKLVSEKKLGIAHALTLMSLPQSTQERLAAKIVQDKLSVANAKVLVRKEKEGLSDNDITRENKLLEAVLVQLCEFIGADIDKSSASMNQITLKGFSIEALQGLYDAMAPMVEKKEEKKEESTVLAC